MKALLIARVSDPEQRVALPAQEKRLLDYGKSKEFDYQYVEFDETAYKDNRKKFRELVMEPLKNSSELTIVVFDKIDRFSRDSSSDEKTFLTTLFRKGLIELHFPSDNLFIHKDSPAADLFRLDIGVALAGYYSSAIRDNVKRRFEQKLKDKEWCGWAPVGYLNHRIDEKHTTVIRDPERDYLIAEAFELRRQGNSFRQIAQILNSKGLTNKSKARNQMTSGNMEKILKNPFYYGEMLYKGKLYPHDYEPLISKWLFDEVQKVNEGRATNRTKSTGKEFITKGLIRCGYCGLAISADIKKGRYVYLMCNQFKGKCGAVRIREEVALDQIKDIFKSIEVPDDALKKVTDELGRNQLSEREHYERTKSRLRHEDDQIDKRIKVMYQDRLDGRISAQEYDDMVVAYKDRQKDIGMQLEDLVAADEQFLVSASYILSLANRAVELFEADSSEVEQKRSLIGYVLSNLELKGEKLSYNLKEPFDALVGLSQNNNWLRGEDSNLRPIG